MNNIELLSSNRGGTLYKVIASESETERDLPKSTTGNELRFIRYEAKEAPILLIYRASRADIACSEVTVQLMPSI